MIETFLDYLRHERNYSLLTVQSYGRDLEEFQSYFESIDDGLSWWTVDYDVVRAWMEHLMDKGNRVTAINARLRAAFVFLRYCFEQEYLEPFPLSQIKEDESFKRTGRVN